MDFRPLYQSFVIMLLSLQLQHCVGFPFDYDDDNDGGSSRCPWIRNKLKNGRVKIRSRGRIAKFLCDPGFELAGKRFATCVRGQWNNPIPVCVARGCPKLPEPANGRVTEMYRGALLIYDCLPGYVLDGDMSVFCDGRRWNTSLPACVVAKEGPSMSCDFENPDLCGWNHDPTHDFNWQRHQYSTPSGHVGTGPAFDHTYGEGKGGFYLYTEASSPRKVNDTSRIFSPVFPMDYSGGCFAFWYHMYGSTTGGLRVYIKPESSVFDELSPTWEKFGDQGNRWHMENFSIPYFDQNFQIVIEGLRGTSYIGDTAIDDVSLSTTGCDAVGNATESTIELSADSCRGRCQDQDDMIGCGCNDSCFPDSCCSDYTLICTSGSFSVSDNPEEVPAGDTLATAIMLSTMMSVITPESSSVNILREITHSASSLTEFDSTTPIDTTVETFPYSEPNLSTASTNLSMMTTLNDNLSIQNVLPSKSSEQVTTTTNTTDSSSFTTFTLISNSSFPTASATEAGTTFFETELPTVLYSEDKSPNEDLTTINIDTTELEENATTSLTSSAIKPDINFTTLDQISSEVPNNISTVSVLEISPLTESSTNVVIYTFPESTRRTYNLRPRTKKTTLTEEMEATTTPVTVLIPNTSTAIKKNTLIPQTTKDLNETPSYTLLPGQTNDVASVTLEMKSTTPSNSRSNIITTPRVTTKLDIFIPHTTQSSAFRKTSTLRTEFHINTKPSSANPYAMKTTSTIGFMTPRKESVAGALKPSLSTLLPVSIDNSASKSASAAVNSESTVAITCFVLVLVVVFVGGWIFFVRRKRIKRQSKLSDDSELIYLPANEITDY